MHGKEVFCWKCSKKVGDAPLQIGFRASCLHCSASLHSCKNCRYFFPGKPNDCSVPGTEPIRDRESANFCEEFKLRIPSPPSSPKERAKERFHALFKDEPEEHRS